MDVVWKLFGDGFQENEEIDPSYNDPVLNHISYYEEWSESREEIEEKMNGALGIMEQRVGERKLDIKLDLEDPSDRDEIKGLAMDLASLSPGEREKVAQLAKAVDRYENQLKNREIKKIEKKAKKGRLTKEDRAKLQALLPVQNKGIKLDPAIGKPVYGNEGQVENRQPPVADADQNRDDADEQGAFLEETNGYNREKARDYAYQWWNKRNNDEYGYYSQVNGGCYDCWYDCTNFVSQAMKAGGLVEWKDDPWWYYSDDKPSYAWGVSNSLYKHLEERAQPARSLSELNIGDVVNADLDGDGDIDHSAIITNIRYGQIFVTQHSVDRRDFPLSYWFFAGYDVYGWKLGTADNQPR
ncbi:amidase domain-containing protein [Desmospora profundinema]|uniref:Putative amidase domain-containing protein n=1 Tax=Desmospora profundinema TaxID=1571184 RepID=A0ABU1IMR9_9BACL|nr:amidase domain-containing protein [Desmospora profundinema]MDR6226080.1 hypothetical protein [Desmospora profundinema]